MVSDAMTNLPAEEQVLFCVARRELDDDAVASLRNLLTQSLDWDYLHTFAFDQGLLMLLATHLVANCADLLPLTVLNRLRTELLTNRQSNLYLLSELVRVLSQFEKAGIDALAFKGPVLAQLAYEDTGMRQAGDLDILIRREDFGSAVEALRELRYEMGFRLTAAQQKARLRFHCELFFPHANCFSVVDLHWGITPKTFPLTLTSDDFLANRRKTSVAGQTIDTFTDEDLIFYLSLHAAKHYFRKLEWMTTIAELIRNHSALSWSTLRAKASETKTEKIVCLTLMLVESVYRLPLPDAFKDLGESVELKKTVGEIRSDLLASPIVPRGLKAFRWNLRFLTKKDAYLSFARATFLPTVADWQAFSLPDVLYPAYYLLRPMRLLTKYGGRRED